MVVLPIVLILIAVARGRRGRGQWLGLLGRLLMLGPAVGFAIGGLGSW